MDIKTKERVVVNESVEIDAGCVKLNLTREGDGSVLRYSCRDSAYGSYSIFSDEKVISELSFHSKELGEVSIELKAFQPSQLLNHEKLAKEILKLFKSGE